MKLVGLLGQLTNVKQYVDPEDVERARDIDQEIATRNRQLGELEAALARRNAATADLKTHRLSRVIVNCETLSDVDDTTNDNDDEDHDDDDDDEEADDVDCANNNNNNNNSAYEEQHDADQEDDDSDHDEKLQLSKSDVNHNDDALKNPTNVEPTDDEIYSSDSEDTPSLDI